MHRIKDLTRKVKRGRRVCGAVYTLPSGAQVYMAWRLMRDLFRGGEKVLSTAIADGKASWAIDDEILRDCQRAGIRYVGVWLRDSDDKFIAPLEAFFDKTKAQKIDYEARGGVVQRYLPLCYFSHSAGSTRIK